jgi:hypothetical protein
MNRLDPKNIAKLLIRVGLAHEAIALERVWLSLFLCRDAVKEQRTAVSASQPFRRRAEELPEDCLCLRFP